MAKVVPLFAPRLGVFDAYAVEQESVSTADTIVSYELDELAEIYHCIRGRRCDVDSVTLSSFVDSCAFRFGSVVYAV